jgi:vacuolar-type H+-ATPase subunit I/STV1
MKTRLLVSSLALTLASLCYAMEPIVESDSSQDGIDDSHFAQGDAREPEIPAQGKEYWAHEELKDTRASAQSLKDRIAAMNEHGITGEELRQLKTDVAELSLSDEIKCAHLVAHVAEQKFAEMLKLLEEVGKAKFLRSEPLNEQQANVQSLLADTKTFLEDYHSLEELIAEVKNQFPETRLNVCLQQ